MYGVICRDCDIATEEKMHQKDKYKDSRESQCFFAKKLGENHFVYILKRKEFPALIWEFYMSKRWFLNVLYTWSHGMLELGCTMKLIFNPFSHLLFSKNVA